MPNLCLRGARAEHGIPQVTEAEVAKFKDWFSIIKKGRTVKDPERHWEHHVANLVNFQPPGNQVRHDGICQGMGADSIVRSMPRESHLLGI